MANRQKAEEKSETQEKFENILGKLVSVSKRDIEEREKLEKEKKQNGREKKKEVFDRNRE